MKAPSLIKVPYTDLAAQHAPIKDELMQAVSDVFTHGKFVLGPEVEQLEEKFAQLVGTKYAVALNSGTDALMLVLKAFGIGTGDEVITVANTYITTVSSIVLVGATPVLIDVLDDYAMDPSMIEKAITSKTKAILPVHLTGHPCDMTAIKAIADKHNLKIIEDAAQAITAECDGRSVGSWGDAGCFSLHPLKTLNACGDGGMVTTDNEVLAEQLKALRNNGCLDRDDSIVWSNNSRLDTIQAAILLVKMKYVDQWTEKRISNATYYIEQLQSVQQVTTPKIVPHKKSVFHTFVIQADKRDELQHFLDERGVKTKRHYPRAVHQQTVGKNLDIKFKLTKTEEQANRILSLPIHDQLTKEQIDYVVAQIKEFYGEES